MLAFDIVWEASVGAAVAALPRLRYRTGLALPLVHIPCCIVGSLVWTNWQAMYTVNLDDGGAIPLTLITDPPPPFVRGRRKSRSHVGIGRSPT